MKTRRTVADSVANVGECGERDRCLGTFVAYLGVNSERTHVYLYIYISIVTARPLSPQEDIYNYIIIYISVHTYVVP